ncbi:terminase [Pseudoalteromonas sp. C2R02]|uniref:terminase n=1 Tax=Pseudoalteromonas sp. C2R02 TaxID=2841565 RepID=UPI001C08F53D|nr:terminase [Pseudoalteromonas sp. C2R02]MBU2968743.1 terminase [Pseudoalteromonas sp. C2R02]
MSKKHKSLTTDKRYKKLVKQYRFDWVALWLYLTPESPPSMQQVILLNSVCQLDSKVSVASGHGTGKSYGSAEIIIIFMLMFPESQVFLVANSVAQVKAAVWKNLKSIHSTVVKRHPWLAKHLMLTESEFYVRGFKGRWNCRIKSCRIGQEENLAGEHNEHFLYIIDEASGVSDKAHESMSGACTQSDNRMLLLSQPTRLTGKFYDTHHSLAKKSENDDTGWTALVFNSVYSDFVTEKFLRQKLREYGGVDSLEFRVRVLGLFPDKMSGYLLTLAECERATRVRPTLASDWGYAALFDVGNGRDSSVLLIVKVSGYGVERRVVPVFIKEYPTDIRPLEFASHIFAECNEDKYPNISIAGDGDGIGAATIEKLEELGLSVQAIHWGLPCHSSKDKKRFNNRRTYAHWMTLYAIQQGRMRLDKNTKTSEQGSKLPFSMNDKGVIAMMGKQDMKKQGIDSPDRFDTYNFTQLVDYMPANVIVPDSAKAKQKEDEKWLESEME